MITLHERLVHLINKHSPRLRHEWEQRSPIKSSEGEIYDISKVNQYLRITLGMLPLNTTGARESLYETDDVSTWLTDFETYVLPLLLQYNTVSHHHP